MVLVPSSQFREPHINIERFGFIATTIIQLFASYVLYLALHHEVQYRSSGKRVILWGVVVKVAVLMVAEWWLMPTI